MRSVVPAVVATVAAMGAVGAAVPAKAEGLKNMAESAGFTTCSKGLGELGKFLLQNSDWDSHALFSKKKVDKRIYNTFVVKAYRGNVSHISITASRQPSGGCSYTYTETFVAPQTCTATRKELYPETGFARGMAGETRHYTKDGLYVYMTPQGGGERCLVTRRQILFR